MSLVRPGQTVLDVGANFGNYTVLFSDIVRSYGKVYAFEPVRATAHRLQQNIQGRTNVIAVRKALGAGEYRTTMFTPGNDLGQSSLARHAAGSWLSCQRVEEEETEVTTLDSFADSCGISTIDFIKVDIEGAEPLFLSGGEQTIRRFRPILYLELNAQWLRKFDESPDSLARKLSQWGYSFVYEPVVNGHNWGFKCVTVSHQSNSDFVFCIEPLKTHLLRLKKDNSLT